MGKSSCYTILKTHIKNEKKSWMWWHTWVISTTGGRKQRQENLPEASGVHSTAETRDCLNKVEWWATKMAQCAKVLVTQKCKPKRKQLQKLSSQFLCMLWHMCSSSHTFTIIIIGDQIPKETAEDLKWFLLNSSWISNNPPIHTHYTYLNSNMNIRTHKIFKMIWLVITT